MSLIHYWPLDEAEGASAKDIVTGVDATVFAHDGDSIVDGVFGKARDLSISAASNSYIQLRPSDTTADEYSQWSLLCWARRGDGWTSSAVSMMWRFGQSSAFDSLAMEYDAGFTGEEIYIEWSGSAGSGSLEAALDLSDNQWHLIVIRSDGASIEAVVDNSLEGSGGNAVDIAPSASDAFFGEGFRTYGDLVDDLAIFSHALTDQEISNIWNDGGGASIQSLYLGNGGPAPFIPPERADQVYYRAELRDGSNVVKLPISSWQATLQVGRQSYLQCVVPAAEQYIDAITEIGLESDLAVIRGALLPDGSTTELDMAVVPLQQMPYQRGPQRSTVMLSGYGDLDFSDVDPEDPPEGSTLTLSGVQTISTGSGTRARAEVDWLLRPGMIAVADGVSFQVAYINYYANNVQEFMDVGSRPL